MIKDIIKFTIGDNYSKSTGLHELTHLESVRSAAINSRTTSGLATLIDALRRSNSPNIASTKVANGVVNLPTTIKFSSGLVLADEVGKAIRDGKTKEFNLLLPNAIMSLIPPSRRDLLAIEVSELLIAVREAIIREAFPGAEALLEKHALLETEDYGGGLRGLNYLETVETFKSASKKGFI